MNKKSLKSKLSFNKETLRTLSDATMAQVQGGDLSPIRVLNEDTCNNACMTTTNALCGSACGPCTKCLPFDPTILVNPSPIKIGR